jgi:hypothetical protein
VKAENFFYIIITIGIFGLFATMLYFETNESIEPVKTIDFNVIVDFNVMHDRFDRLEAGIQNSTRDICFQWGGQWLTDENGVVIRELDNVQAILCIKPKT